MTGAELAQMCLRSERMCRENAEIALRTHSDYPGFWSLVPAVIERALASDDVHQAAIEWKTRGAAFGELGRQADLVGAQEAPEALLSIYQGLSRGFQDAGNALLKESGQQLEAFEASPILRGAEAVEQLAERARELSLPWSTMKMLAAGLVLAALLAVLFWFGVPQKLVRKVRAA